MQFRTAIRWGMGLLLGTAVGLLLLISSGAFDPQVLGAAVWQEVPGTLDISANSRDIRWSGCPLLPSGYTVRAAATTPDENHFFYGIALGEPGTLFAVMVSPTGYVTIRDQNTTLLPLQTWPHVRPDGNEIWINVGAGQLTVRINGELLWQGADHLSGQRVGVIAESRSRSATVSFSDLTCYAENAPWR